MLALERIADLYSNDVLKKRIKGALLLIAYQYKNDTTAARVVKDRIATRILGDPDRMRDELLTRVISNPSVQIDDPTVLTDEELMAITLAATEDYVAANS
jgi:hypothetical protein